MAIFVIFSPILANNWLPRQRPLDPCNQKCLLWIGWPQKPPVISNHILAISRRNSFMCIYNNFSPKIGCHDNAPFPLCTKLSPMNSFIEQILSQNQTLRGCVAYNWSYDHLCDTFAYFGLTSCKDSSDGEVLHTRGDMPIWSVTQVQRLIRIRILRKRGYYNVWSVSQDNKTEYKAL